MKLTWEKNYPKVLAGVALLVAWFAFPHLPHTGHAEPLLSSTINLAGIAIGFLATAKAIVYSLGSSRLMKAYRDLGYTKHLADYFMSAIYWSFFLAALSAACLVLRGSVPHMAKLGLEAVWVAILVGALAAYHRILMIFQLILRSPPTK